MTDSSLISQLKVLYIEDDDMTREELARYLKKRVGQLTATDSCEKAIDYFAKEVVDLVITDLRMPGMNGLQFIERLRSVGNNTPVIITSAFSDSETILQAVDLGIVKYVVKPIALDALMKATSEVAAAALKNKGTYVFNDMPILERESKLELEKQLKRELAHLIKQLTGKGPKDVTVFLKQTSLEVQFVESLTLMEFQLAKSSHHHSLVTAFRRTFYESVSEQLSDSIQLILGGKASLSHVKINLVPAKDALVFELS